MVDTFISYRREDGEDFSKKLSDDLKKIGCNVFFDRESIRIGNDFPKVINESIKEANDVILVVSKSYFGKNKDGITRINDSEDWVRKEIALALKLNKNIIPILINNQNDYGAANLPEEISKVLYINFMKYCEGDDYSNFLTTIESSLTDQTKKNIKYGKYLQLFSDIESEKTPDFSNKIKKIASKINKEELEKYILPLIKSKENIEIRFITFYTAYTFLRRNKNKQELYSMISAFKDEFAQFNFMNVVMTQYYLYKFEEDKANIANLDSAIEYSKRAIEKIDGNFGVFITYSELIMIGLEYNRKYKNQTREAIESVEKSLKIEKDYPKSLYIYGKLLSEVKEYDKAIIMVEKAISLEEKEKSDSFIRIIDYELALYEIKNKRKIERFEKKIIISIMLISFLLILLFSFLWRYICL